MNQLRKLRPLNLQMFSEGPESGEGQQQQQQQPPQQQQQTSSPQQTPQGKTFTEDYVSALREEAKSHRLAKKQYEAHLRTVLGLAPDAEINDAAVTAYQTNQTKTVTEALSKANARLVSAEIKSLEGYDTKLLDKLIDRSKVTVEDDGTVKGLTEQLAELEKEFPAIKVVAQGGAVNPGASGGKSELQQLEEAYAAAKNTAERIAIKNKIHALLQKQT